MPVDPDVRQLRDVERVLFPRPLVGAQSGWSWEDAAKEAIVPTERAGLEPGSDSLMPTPGPAFKDMAWLNSLAMPDLPVVFTTHVIKYLLFYRDDPRGRIILRSLAKKSGRLVPSIQAELRRAGLPVDLVWLSLVESGHNIEAKSSAGAAGLWQFIPDSAKHYGLTVDRWVDERLDPDRSTEAAVRYLADLYQRFGTWELAMAAYNMGHGGLLRTIRKFSSNDYWALCRYEAGIPWETALYVPKVLALAVAMKNPRAFGLANLEQDVLEATDGVVAPPGTYLSRIALAANAPAEEIYRRNPHFLLKRVPLNQKASYLVRVPRGTGERVSRALFTAGGRAGLARHRVRLGDTAESIAEGAGVSEPALRQLNALGERPTLEVGTVLLLPDPAPGAAKASSEEVVVAVPEKAPAPDLRRVFYRVVGGETLEVVSRAFGVRTAELAAWNTLDAGARLLSGMTLQLYVKKSQKLDEVRYIAADSARILAPGTTEFYDHFEGLNGNKRLVVRARQGDTLASLGERYGMTLGSIERVNRRSRNDALAEGEPVVVYSRAPRADNPAALPESKLAPLGGPGTTARR